MIAVVTALLVFTLAAPAQQNALPAEPLPQPTTPQPSTQSQTQVPVPLSTPPITGPLKLAAPITIDGGPLGKLSLDGVQAGTGLVQSNDSVPNDSSEAALSDAQLFLQKPTGWGSSTCRPGPTTSCLWGHRSFPRVKQVSDSYGPVPVAYLKFVPARNPSLQIVELLGLVGAEYTFDFENMNIERGLLWNQGNSVNRGVQINESLGRFTASFSWNDGYYSNRYSWLSGSLTHTQGPHSLAFGGMGNLGHTAYEEALPLKSGREGRRPCRASGAAEKIHCAFRGCA